MIIWLLVHYIDMQIYNNYAELKNYFSFFDIL